MNDYEIGLLVGLGFGAYLAWYLSRPATIPECQCFFCLTTCRACGRSYDPPLVKPPLRPVPEPQPAT